jgi:hypothetical protein
MPNLARPNPKPWLTLVPMSICFPQYDETYLLWYGLEERVLQNRENRVV